jgi:hypothetical protein
VGCGNNFRGAGGRQPVGQTETTPIAQLDPREMAELLASSKSKLFVKSDGYLPHLGVSAPRNWRLVLKYRPIVEPLADVDLSEVFPDMTKQARSIELVKE